LKTNGITLRKLFNCIRLSKTTTVNVVETKNTSMETEHQNQIGESSTSQTFTQSGPLDIIRTETVLSKLPIHNLSKKGRVNIQITRQGPDGSVELKWEVSYSDRYGQARQLAYKLDTIVIDQRIEEAGRPLPERLCLGSLRDIADQLDLGGDTNKVRSALRQNASAFITAKFKYKANDGTERTLEADFTRYSVVFTGEKFPDGARADAVYILLNPPYRDVLNNAPMRPLDLAYKKQLPPGPQRFYEIVSYKVFAALKNNLPVARLAYSEYCTFSAQHRYFVREQFRKQMFKIHEPHKKSGYIASVDYDDVTDAKGNPDWVMKYVPGPKAIAEYATFSGKRTRIIDAARATALPASAGESITPVHRPRQRRLKLSPVAEPSASPVIDYRLVAELGKRGVGEIDARQLLASLPPGQPIQDQLEWGDIQVEQAKGKITNPPGFYISLLQRNIPLPSTFESSATRNARQQAEFSQTEALQKQRQAAQEAEDATRRQADERMAALPPEAHQALLDQARTEIFREHPFMAKQKDASAIHEGAIRARMRNLLKDGWSFYQATNPVIRQADRLQEPAEQSLHPVAEQPQSAPVDQAEALRSQYEDFCRQQAQAAIDALDMMERGRRMRAARMYLLNEHPQKDYYHQLVTDEKYEEFHRHSVDQLIAATVASLNLPNLEAWKATQTGADRPPTGAAKRPG
jgi:hypothetical protein